MTADYSFLTTAIASTNLGLAGNLTVLLLLAVCAIAITRNSRHLKLLLFPLSLAFSAAGVATNIIFEIAFGVVWAVTLVGPETIGQGISAITNTVAESAGEAYQRTPFATSRTQRRAVDAKLRENALRDAVGAATYTQDIIAKTREKSIEERAKRAATFKGSRDLTRGYLLAPQPPRKDLKHTQLIKNLGPAFMHTLGKQARAQRTFRERERLGRYQAEAAMRQNPWLRGFAAPLAPQRLKFIGMRVPERKAAPKKKRSRMVTKLITLRN